MKRKERREGLTETVQQRSCIYIGGDGQVSEEQIQGQQMGEKIQTRKKPWANVPSSGRQKGTGIKKTRRPYHQTLTLGKVKSFKAGNFTRKHNKKTDSGSYWWIKNRCKGILDQKDRTKNHPR